MVPSRQLLLYPQGASSYRSAGRGRLFRLLHRSSTAFAIACREWHAAPSEATVNHSLQQQSKFPARYFISVSLEYREWRAGIYRTRRLTLRNASKSLHPPETLAPISVATLARLAPRLQAFHRGGLVVIVVVWHV